MFRRHIIMGNKRYLKNKAVPLIQQGVRLRKLYEGLIDSISISKSKLVCVMHLQPSEHSDTYTVKIIYKLSDFSPKVWLIAPSLKTVSGKRPHHIYEVDEEGRCRLCVYDPKLKEWNQQMFIAESFVPWICTWLNTYEYWVITGVWHYDETLQSKVKAEKVGE